MLTTTPLERVRRDCTCPVARHEHGTAVAYTADRCRCADCTAANSAAADHRRRQIAYGRWAPVGFVDAEPARRHVQALRAAGLGIGSIATASGVSFSSINRLIYGEKGGRPSAQIRPSRATALLAVRADWRTLPDGARVDAVGTVRRLQALACLGWTQPRLARELGSTAQHAAYLFQPGGLVTAATARTVARLYDRLWDVTPTPADRWEAGGITRSRTRAAASGWAPPLAWDDETIDDPAAEPQHALTVTGPKPLDEAAIARRVNGDTRVQLTNEERREVVRLLHSQGLNDGEIERLTGINDRQVLRDRQRLGLEANAENTSARGAAA